MADLNEGDRGQIILIAAFTLAVTFVALALVINSAIFTENLASRGEISGSSEALSYQHEIRTGVADTIEYANVHNHTILPGTVAATVDEGVDAIALQGSNQQAIDGQVVDVEFDPVTDVTDGTRIVSNETSNFESADGDFDWKLAEDVQNTRAFVIDISNTGSLQNSWSSAFRVELNNTGSPDRDWNVSIQGSGPNVVVETRTPNGDVETCSVPDPGSMTVDITDAVVDGTHCPALDRMVDTGTPMGWATGLSSYNISFENAHQIEGNYSMVIGPNGAPVGAPEFDSYPNDPYTTDAVYSAEVRYVYRTANVVYDTTIEVAPGDPND